MASHLVRIAAALCIVCSSLSVAVAQTEFRVPDDVVVLRDVECGTTGDRPLRLHLAYAKNRGAAPQPALVWIHGGGWTGGSRHGGLRHIVQWARRGYVAASIEYRLSNEAKFPAQIEDCKCAIRFLRAKAAEYGIDPEHIGVAGHSAGGHLAALLGTSGELKELEGKGGHGDFSSAVQAVCDVSGPTDFVTWGADAHPAVRGLLGGPVLEKPELAALAAPVTHVKKTTPPFLIIHGDQDDVVPVWHARAMNAALTKAGADSTLLVLEGVDHMPYGEKTSTAMNDFFDRTLKPTAKSQPGEQGTPDGASRPRSAKPPIAGRDPARVRILFGGDTSTGESYQDQYVRDGEYGVLADKGYEYGLARLAPLLAAADYRVINLETPLTLRRVSPLTTKDYLHYSDPVKLPALFKPFGPVAYSLANNHTLDHGREGLDDTAAALAAAGAEWFGAGDDLAQAAQPLQQAFQTTDGPLTLAVLGAFEYRTDYDEDFHFYAGAKRAGAAPIDVAAAEQTIVQLRREVPNVFVVYFVHWGGNYSWRTDEQQATAKRLREAGVDLVVGHGAHMLQEVERDERGWIFYSIGNFLFNARGRYAAHQAPPYSLPLSVDLSLRDGRVEANLRVHPIVSDNQMTGYQPRPVTETELATIETLLAEKSGWDDAARAAVRRGVDDFGPYLEFATK